MSNLKKFRQYLNLSQPKFADKLGVSQGAYNNYEMGNRKIPTPILEKLSRFGLNIDWLITNCEPMLKADLAKSADSIDLKSLTHYQKAEIVIADITQRYQDAGGGEIDHNALQKLTRGLADLSEKNNFDLGQLFEHCKMLIKPFLEKSD